MNGLRIDLDPDLGLMSRIVDLLIVNSCEPAALLLLRRGGRFDLTVTVDEEFAPCLGRLSARVRQMPGILAVECEGAAA